MNPTPEMIEAADKVLSAEFSNTLDTADLARRAITAALALLPGEPIATVAEIGAGGHRWLVPHPLSALDHIPIGTPLYTSPTSQAVG